MTIQELKELTEQMPDLSDIVMKGSPGHVEYKTKNGGVCLGFPLHNCPGVAVQRSYMPKGAKISEHVHNDCKEIGIAYKGGSLIVKRNGVEEKYEIGEVIIIKKGEPHTIEAVSDSWMIFLTIPADKGYPDYG